LDECDVNLDHPKLFIPKVVLASVIIVLGYFYETEVAYPKIAKAIENSSMNLIIFDREEGMNSDLNRNKNYAK
jgi:hypothetical protein